MLDVLELLGLPSVVTGPTEKLLLIKFVNSSPFTLLYKDSFRAVSSANSLPVSEGLPISPKATCKS